MTVNTDSISMNVQDQGLIKNRSNISNVFSSIREKKSEVTVSVLAYNRIDKTKRCVESILKHSKNVDYDLILIDNGSNDETLEYFKSIDYEKKQVIHITKNLGASFAFNYISLNSIADYYVNVSNDLIVTSNWLRNLLDVAKSDLKIGMVCPVSSNVSNFQQVSLNFETIDEMQYEAAKYNISNPQNWDERLRLVTVMALFSKRCLYAIGWPYSDIGFLHDFSDDDVTFKIRRAGYKAILAKDTWIHHNHDFRNMEGKDPVEFEKSLRLGRQNFKDKYYGIDAWDDTCNFIYYNIINSITMPLDFENTKILGVDVRCGTPILDIKNIIREYGIFDPGISAFSTDAKYEMDLKTICNENVVCDRIDFLYNSFKSNNFDYIVIDKNINEYHQPERVVRDAYALLKNGGQMYISLKNTYNIFSLMKILGHEIDYVESAVHYNVETFAKLIHDMGIDIELVDRKLLQCNDDIRNYSLSVIQYAGSDSKKTEDVFNDLITDRYWLKIVKKIK